MTDDDAQLIERLGTIARTVDPVPEMVSEMGMAVFGLLRLDAELAELVEDSDTALTGVRSGGSDVRLLTFEAGELVVEAQVTRAGGRHTVLGQVVVPLSTAGGTVRLEKPDSTAEDASLDKLGNFRFEGVPASTVRLRMELPGGRTVATTWFSL